MGLGADGYQLVGTGIESHYRGLVDYNFIVVDYDSIGGAKVYRNLFGQ